jgi:hypothetical protein
VHADGAGYDARTGRWGRLPLATEAQLPDNDSAATVWTGREVLIWGGFTVTDPVNNPNTGRPAGGLAYDPARRTWRKLAARPPALKSLGIDSRAVWTGRELLVTGVQEADSRGGAVGAAYDPAADRWRLLPPSPPLTGDSRHLQARTAVWAGTRMLVWNFWSSRPRPAFDESGATDPAGVEPDGIDLWAYDPASNRWSVLPTPPSEVRRMVVDGSMVWDGHQLVMAARQVEVVAGKNRAVAAAGRYDPATARWTPIADSPPLPGRLRLAWAGSAVVELSSNAVYDPAGDRWLPLPAPASRAAPPSARPASSEPWSASTAPQVEARSSYTSWSRTSRSHRVWGNAGGGAPRNGRVPGP